MTPRVAQLGLQAAEYTFSVYMITLTERIHALGYEITDLVAPQSFIAINFAEKTQGIP